MRSFEVGHDLIDGGPQFLLTGNDPSDLGVEFDDVHFFASVLGLDVGRDRDVVVVVGNLRVVDESSEMIDVRPIDEGCKDLVAIRLGENVLDADSRELGRRVDEERGVVRFRLLGR